MPRPRGDHDLRFTGRLRCELLPVTRAIVDAGPRCEGWEFYPAKPRKALTHRIYDVQGHNGEMTRIDATSWTYVLREKGGRFEVIVSSGRMSDNIAQTAARLVIEGEIGEEMLMQWIADIIPMPELPPDLRDSAGPLDVLWLHLVDLTRESLGGADRAGDT